MQIYIVNCLDSNIGEALELLDMEKLWSVVSLLTRAPAETGKMKGVSIANFAYGGFIVKRIQYETLMRSMPLLVIPRDLNQPKYLQQRPHNGLGLPRLSLI